MAGFSCAVRHKPDQAGSDTVRYSRTGLGQRWRNGEPAPQYGLIAHDEIYAAFGYHKPARVMSPHQNGMLPARFQNHKMREFDIVGIGLCNGYCSHDNSVRNPIRFVKLNQQSTLQFVPIANKKSPRVSF